MSGMRKLADVIFGPSASAIVEGLRDKLFVRRNAPDTARYRAILRRQIRDHSSVIEEQCRGRFELDLPACIEVLERTRQLRNAIKNYRKLLT